MGTTLHDPPFAERGSKKHRLALRYLRLLFLLMAVHLASDRGSVFAQSQSPNYWQYPASGRIRHALTADVNHDNIDEFLVVDANGNVDLLSSDGALLWSHNTREAVSTIGVVNIDGPGQPELEIVLGVHGRLILLSVKGEVLWSVRLTLAPPSDAPVLDDLGAATALLALPAAIPNAIHSFDQDSDGKEEILVLLASGQLQLYDAAGKRLWQYGENDLQNEANAPSMAIGDMDGDGQAEIALGSFDPARRFSQLVIVDGEGRMAWDQEQSVSGRITALTLMHFEGERNPLIAVGNNIGQVNLYDDQRQRLWQRTLNKPITTMTSVPLSDGPGLVVGTSVGSLVAFSREGRRTWTRYLADDADRSVVSLTAAKVAPQEDQPALSVIISPVGNDEESGDVLLLASNGRTLDTFAAVDTARLTQLTDVNRDGNSELLLARFSQIELLGLGLGASEIAKGWDYNLFSEPESVLVIDLDQDGTDELLIGTQDGRIHSLDNNKSIRWLHAPGGAITHLAALPDTSGGPPAIVAVRNVTTPGPEEELLYTSWLELRQANGKQSWEQVLSTRINTMTVADFEGRGEPKIIVGTADGRAVVYSAAGELLWEARISGGIQHLLVLERGNTRRAELIVASKNQVFSISEGIPPRRITVTNAEIYGIYGTPPVLGDEVDSFLIFAADGTVRKQLVSPGVRLPQWVLPIGGKPSANLPARGILGENPEGNDAASFVVATETSQLKYVTLENNQPTVTWERSNFSGITSLILSDLDGDGLSEMAVGSSSGDVSLFKIRSNGEPMAMVNLDLSSSVRFLTAMYRGNEQESDLLAITNNGLVQLFRAQENWPPLLTTPRVEATPNQTSIVVSVQDIEDDDVAVWLEVLEPGTNAWTPREEKLLSGGAGTLFWLVDNAPKIEDGITYRFHYDDGFHQGYVMPPKGPPIPPLPPAALRFTPASIGLLATAGMVFVVVLMRQAQLPAAAARRFYRRLRRQVTQSLTLLEKGYTYTNGSPDFLLHLASQARQRDDTLLASLADGLFLLADQPHAGMPIILNALEEAAALNPSWEWIERWQMTCRTGMVLLEAPTVTELTLLRPQLMQLLDALEEKEQWSPILDALLPILTSLRDSERVEHAEDRIFYLNEAATLLERLEEQLPEFSPSIEKTMVAGILRRWSGLVSAEIEDLYGRAELAVNLKTKRIAPSHETDVVLVIQNHGRAAAENLIAELNSDPAYVVCSSPQVVRLLPPGRARQISFAIEPKVTDRFRIALTISFDDRSRRDKTVAFGDMVHLLPPVRDFRPIANPYLPGTPLRRNSSIFYGRQELFNFISENAGELSQRNVLILVGERRTGKTSILLRLEQHLPSHLVPIYIDCQSLGVLPGMPAFLHDLAWYVADALAMRGVVLDVPDPADWQEDPSGLFERRFLPQARASLPAGTTLLLVFDEFEVFESLVDDGILPPTLFPYLRHLMQHSEGLSFVFVGTRRLEEMSSDYWSVLFNIALYQKIGYLSDASATSLICEPVKPNLVYDDLALDKILRVTTGHPYFLQLVCYTLVKRANAERSSYATISDVNAALDEMLKLGEVHFAYLWQRSTHVERALLTAMAHLVDRDVPFHPADLVNRLKPYGIYLSAAEVTAALQHLVERDILCEVAEGVSTLYEMKVGLVGLWVAQYKSLSSLLMGNGESYAKVTRNV